MQEDEPIGSQQESDQLPVDRHRPLVPSSASPGRLLSLEKTDGDFEADKEDVDIRHYWRVLLKRKWTVLSTAGIVFLTALVVVLVMTPIYRASTTIEIDRDTQQVMQVEGMNSGNDSDVSVEDTAYYKTQYQLLQSNTLARRVAAQAHLANDPEYQQLDHASALSRLMAMLIPNQKQEAVTLSSDAQSAKLGDWILKHLDIEPVKETRLVTVNFDTPSPDLSARIANAIADNFIAANMEHTFNASAYARTYLEGRLAQLKQKLSDSAAHLVDIATQERLFLDVDGKTPLTTSNLAALNGAMAQAQDARLRAESRWKLASTLPNDALPGDMLGNSIVLQLRQQRAQMAADYQQKLAIYKPGYPLMVALKTQIDSLDKQISAEYSAVKQSIRSEYEAAVSHESMLQAQMEVIKKEVIDSEQRIIVYNVAERDVESNQQLYSGLLERYKEIGIAGGITTNNMSIVDRADVPVLTYSPNILLDLPIAAVFGLVLGVLLALFFEYLDDTIKTPEDIEELLGLAVLGVIPRLKGMAPSEAMKDPRSAFAEAYRSVRTALQFSTASGVPRSLLVTSATPAEGKSTTAMTLALNFAQLGKRVLLIDADLRNPSLHRSFNLDNSKGLSNFLSGAIKPQDAIQKAPDSDIDVMTAGPLPPDPAELLAGPKMLSLLTIAVAKYDQVIIDAPPTIGLADALITSHIAMGTMLVIDSGSTRRDVARGAVKRLLSSRARLIGAVMTKFDPKTATYGYGYGSYSYYTYGADQPKLAKQ